MAGKANPYRVDPLPQNGAQTALAAIREHSAHSLARHALQRIAARETIRALDPALTPICVSYVGRQEAPAGAFDLFNIEETIDDNLVLHSTVSLQTIAAYGYRPVMV